MLIPASASELEMADAKSSAVAPSPWMQIVSALIWISCCWVLMTFCSLTMRMTCSSAVEVSVMSAFGWLRGVSFAFIWLGAAVYAAGAIQRSRAARVVAVEPGLLDDPAEDRSAQSER